MRGLGGTCTCICLSLFGYAQNDFYETTAFNTTMIIMPCCAYHDMIIIEKVNVHVQESLCALWKAILHYFFGGGLFLVSRLGGMFWPIKEKKNLGWHLHVPRTSKTRMQLLQFFALSVSIWHTKTNRAHCSKLQVVTSGSSRNNTFIGENFTSC